MSSADDYDKDKIEAAFYAQLESEFTEEELEELGMKDANVTVTFMDGSQMGFKGVDSNKLLSNLAQLGFVQMMDGTGARVTVFQNGVMYMIAEGSQHE